MIAVDATSAAEWSSGTTVTVSHTCTGSNLILFAAVESASVGNTVTTSGVTYNGVAMTIVGSSVNAGTDNRRYDLWYLLAPATGAHDIVVTYSGTPAQGAVAAASYTGAKQSGVPDATDSFVGSAVTHATKAITTVADNCWLVAVGGECNGVYASVDAGTTLRVGSTNKYSILLDSNGAKTPAGSYALGYNTTNPKNLCIVVASFAPPSAGGGIRGYFEV